MEPGVFKLTSLQQGMLYHSVLSPGSGFYLQQCVIELFETVDPPSMQRAWQTVVDRHDILHASFHLTHPDGPSMRVESNAKLSWTYQDWSSQSPLQQSESLEQFLQKDAASDLPQDRAPLMRVVLVRRGLTHWVLIISSHHALLDGRSRKRITQEALQLHSDFVEGKTPSLPDPVPFSTFLQWVQSRDHGADQAYWKTQLSGFDTPNALRFPPPAPDSIPAPRRMKEVRANLPASCTSQLQQIAKAEGVTLNTVLQSAWALLIQFYSGQDDVLFGVTRSGRSSIPESLHSGVGLYITTLPLRVTLQPHWTWGELLRAVRQTWTSMQPHEHAGLDSIQQWSDVPRGTGLFETILVYERGTLQESLQKAGGPWTHRTLQLRESANHPVTLAIYGEQALFLKLEFDASRFDGSVGSMILFHFAQVLESVASNPAQALAAIPILTAPELVRLKDDWQPPKRTRPAQGGYVAAFENRVRLNPDLCAIEACDGSWTYAEMNRRANQLAHHLTSLGIQQNARVGLLMERGRDLGVALMGILKTGAGYVPLDPQYPAERLRFMLADAAVKVVVTTSKLMGVVGAESVQRVVLDEMNWGADGSPGSNPSCDITSDTLAYVIYTSGSTGEPKGVELTHRGLLNHNLSFIEATHLKEGDRVLQVCSLTFDISIEEMFPTWLAGATLVPAPPEKILPDRSFTRFVTDRKLTLLDLSTAFWHEWILELQRSGDPFPQTLRLMVVGGEKSSAAAYAQWLKVSGGNIRWIDGYGPTEITVAVTLYEPDRSAVQPRITGGQSIGKPIPNARAWIVDTWGRLVPTGIPGELWIGGAGVARGYLNRPDLTREKFIADPFAPTSCDPAEARVYRTGDLVRYHFDGNIEFLGRLDQQVKIRGYRIELGEVEGRLAKHSGIKQVLVMAREDVPGDRRLVAYYVPSEPAPTPALLKEHLARELPAYMIPSAWVALDQFPLTSNGKIHRKALPAPTLDSTIPRDAGSMPVGELEQKLARIWEEVLGVSQVSRQDHFFELGGHSLLAVRLFSTIESKLGHNVPITALFEAPTLAGLAAWIQQHHSDAAPGWSSLVPIQPRGNRLPLFCVHAAGGNVLFYRDLANRLGPDQPFYGLQPRGLDGRLPFHETMQEMAASYIAEIRKLQPQGPYHLGGSSYGGVVIWEMAQQLKAAGQQVALLALFDTNGPGYPTYRPGVSRWRISLYRTAQRVQMHTGALWLLPRGQRWNYVVQKSKKARLQIWRAGRRGYRRAAAIWHHWVGKPLPDKLRQTQHAIQRAYDQYQLQPYDGPVHLFRASQQPWGIVEDRTLGWGPYAKGELKIIEVPGFHGTMVMEPCVGYLVEAMQPYLPQAGTKTNG